MGAERVTTSGNHHRKGFQGSILPGEMREAFPGALGLAGQRGKLAQESVWKEVGPAETSWQEEDFPHLIHALQQLQLSVCLCKMAEHSKCVLESLGLLLNK